MWLIFAVIVAILLAGLIYLLRLDGNFQIKRSLEIEAPPATVFAAIVDFKTWPAWSPWLMHEADTELVYSENYQAEGGFYSWDGNTIGAGKMTHLQLTPTANIRQQIEFQRPFKAINEVSWGFEKKQAGSLVTWEMRGRMPFLFRFMVRKMESMLGRDFELGLALLNGYLNPEAPHPVCTFCDSETLQDFIYWSIPCNGNRRHLETQRRSSIEALRAAAHENSGFALTLYRHFDPLATHFQAEVAIPVSKHTTASNYTRRDFNGGRYFKMTLQGDHRFLSLGWYALASHCRLHKIKVDRSRPALEIYHNDASEIADSNQLTSTLYIPIR